MSDAAWIDCAGLAELLGMSRSWVEKRVAAHEIPHRRVGSRVRFSPADVRAIERSTAVAPTDTRPVALRRTG